MLTNISKNIIIRALLARMEAGEDPAEILSTYSRLTEEEKQEILKQVTIKLT